jgi:hypothetical protein
MFCQVLEGKMSEYRLKSQQFRNLLRKNDLWPYGIQMKMEHNADIWAEYHYTYGQEVLASCGDHFLVELISYQLRFGTQALERSKCEGLYLVDQEKMEVKQMHSMRLSEGLEVILSDAWRNEKK